VSPTSGRADRYPGRPVSSYTRLPARCIDGLWADVRGPSGRVDDRLRGSRPRLVPSLRRGKLDRHATSESGGGHGSLRVLCTVAGTPSHLSAMLPVFRALSFAGHEVLVATSQSLTARLAMEPVFSVVLFPDVDDIAQDHGRTVRNRGRSFATDDPTVADPALQFVASAGSPLWQDLATALLSLADDFKPDIIYRDDFELSGYLAARTLGIPHIVRTGGTTNLIDLERVAALLSEHRVLPGVDPTELYQYGRIDYLPTAWTARHRRHRRHRPDGHIGSSTRPSGRPRATAARARNC
jgi:hypothetical protein